jgi:hypothetical protein
MYEAESESTSDQVNLNRWEPSLVSVSVLLMIAG